MSNPYKDASEELKKIAVHLPEKDCDQVFCKLHDFLTSDDDDKLGHNCIACNLNDSVEKIYIFCKNAKHQTGPTDNNMEYNFTLYILLCYLLVEKLHTVFKLIGITWDYAEDNWSVLIEIRKWANFIKHPKGFLFSHHPEYVFQNSKQINQHNNYQIIDYNFVTKFYTREDEGKYKQIIKEIGNKDNLLVILPGPKRISEELVIVCKKFVSAIELNPHFQDILKKHTTIEDY